MGGRPRLSCVLLLLLLSAVQFISGQNQQILDNFQFYMDSNADCNGPERDIGNKRAYVFGKGANQLERGPTKCILRLRSVTAFENNQLRLEIAAMTIREDFVSFSIFDGKENQILLRSFDKNNLPDITNTQAIITTGSSVTFVLERRDNEHTQYNIQMIVSPLILGEPGYENNNGNDFGYYYKRISNIGLVGIVVGVFGLTIIVVLAVSVYCYRNQKGMTAKWEQHKLSYVNTTGVSLKPAPSSKGAMSDTASTVWASEVSRNYNQRPPPRGMGPRSRMISASEDEDSVFGDSMDRRRPHDVPAKYSRYGRPPRNAPPRRSYKDESIDDSFVQADDDHPQNTQIERVIEPRVKSSRRPPRSTATTGVGPDGDDEPPPDESEEEEEEDTEEDDTEEEEEEEEDEEEPPKRSQHRPKAPPRKSLANSKTSSHDHVDDPVPQAQAAPFPATVALPPGAAPYPMMAQPGMAPPYMPMGYAAMPPPYQPMAMAPPQHSAPEVQPTQPPIYSYLVQRGYVPVDGRTSPDSVSTAASASSNSRLLRDQGVDRVGGLDSGVELMRR